MDSERFPFSLLSPSLKASPDVYRRARLLIGFVLVLLVLLPFFVALAWFAYRLPIIAGINFVSALLALTALWVLHRFGSLWVATMLITGTVALAVLVVAGSVEGLTSPALVWLAAVPMIATLVAGRRAGILSAALCVFGVILLGALTVAGVVRGHELPVATRQMAAAWNSALLIGFVVGCAVLYEHFRTQAMDALTEAHRQLETATAQRVVTDRLTSVGTFATGVAHEVNNPLAFLLSNVRHVKDELSRLRRGEAVDLADAEDALGEALTGASRVSEIVGDLRLFAQADGEPLAAVDVLAAMQRALKVTARAREGIPEVLELQAVPFAQANSARLTQVLVNLINNAVQSMQGTGRSGELRISVKERDGEVELSIADKGPGISPEVLPRIFDPFFTTREVGQGMGLGLSVTRSLVNAMGGRVEAESRLGEGSVFRVLLRKAGS